MPPSTPMELPQDFLDLLSCFSKARCRYLVVGAHALAVAGRPRFTQDLDILVEPTVQNARRVALALATFGIHELIANKRSTDRPKDHLDAADLRGILNTRRKQR